ncbi:hypothetical protein [Candidatus Galacturonibacter soehngenii]|uniref:Uncharacterized protein n=1 Tax=Candidatus Galacturonatibacter soehngenii TaxID=2307010 RepID=A0A7V7UCS8_9FIRM|nr:hypothetical protein [Candidatus Galacturonibacter soehngenii]KAB1439551.1 hypothetical protein F7O84_03930 [Candidatus Galacturonibacter soehngenii]MBA4687068.1 hypothetical protein [Candidatus Galacturonibacter soehngenii]
MKINKGKYGYIDYNRKRALIKSSIGLSVIIFIFIMGLILTKTRLNWFTFAAVMCALPVGKMVVALIMAWPHKSMPKEEYKRIEEIEKDLCILYDLVITSYENVMQIDSICLYGNTLCAFSKDTKLDMNTTTAYIKDILANNGYGCSMKIYQDLNAYVSRINEMKINLKEAKENEKAIKRRLEKEEKAVETLLAISI